MSVANAYNSVEINGSNWVWFKLQNWINWIIFLLLCDNTFGWITEAFIWWIDQTIFFSQIYGHEEEEEKTTTGFLLKCFIHICFTTRCFVLVWSSIRIDGWQEHESCPCQLVYLCHMWRCLLASQTMLSNQRVQPSTQIGPLRFLLPAPINKPNSHEIGQPLWREQARSLQ